MTGRFQVLEQLADGGSIVRDLPSGRVTTMCPHLHKGSPCECPDDELWAMSCPDDYKGCGNYKKLLIKQKIAK